MDSSCVFKQSPATRDTDSRETTTWVGSCLRDIRNQYNLLLTLHLILSLSPLLIEQQKEILQQLKVPSDRVRWSSGTAKISD